MIFRRKKSREAPKARRRNGLRLALVGMLLGVILGAGKVFIESSVEDLLFTLLNDEAKKACECSFDAEEVHFSLFSMQGKAKNAKILEGETARIVAPQITADFNLFSHLSKKRIALTSLKLFSPTVNSVHPKSGGVRFISSLAKPLTPEQKEEFKIRIKLLSLEVINGTFIEPLPMGSIVGEGVSLQFLRDDKDNLQLTPAARNLLFRREQGKDFSFGNITSSLYITDDDVSIEQLLLSLGRSFLEISGTIDKTEAELLSITGKTEIHGEDLNLTSIPSGRVQGSGALSGSLNEPKGHIELSSDSTSSLTLDIGDTRFAPTTVTATGVLEKLDSGETRFLFDPLSISSPTGSITTRDGITLQNGQLSGALRVGFDSVQFGDTSLLGGKLTITLQGEQGIQIQSKLQAIEFQELRSPPINVDAQITEKTIKLSLSHRSAENGRLRITGAIESYATAPQLSDLLIDITDFNVSPAPKTDRWGQLTLSAKGNFSGPLDDLKQLSGETSLRMSGAVFRGESALNGTLQLKAGVATAQLENANDSILLNLTLPMTTSLISDTSLAHLSVRLSDFQPEDYFPELQCLLIDLSGDYQFLLSEPLQGSGNILLSKLNIGCQPYETTLTAPRRGHIEGGQIDFSTLTFRSSDSHIDITGNVGMNSVDLSATGSVFLQTFLPLTPFLDDLTGTLQLEAKATGTPTDIQLSGTASIRDGGFAAESIDILARGFQGDLLLSPEGIRIDSIFGELNGGRAVFRGNIDQKNLLNSNIHAEFEQLTFQPSIEVYAGISGELSFSHSELGNPQLMGEILIDGGEIIQEFDVRDILSKIPLAIVGRATGTETSSRAPLPDIDMNIDIHSEGNFFVITSFFGIEAAGDVQVRGNLNHPLLRGGITTRRGWLGFNEVRFDIVSGAVEFKPPSIIPTLSVIGETYARGKRGENTLIVLEAKGSLLQPRISLSSDEGLSQREILALLGTRSDFRVSSTTFEEAGVLELPTSYQGPRKKSFLGRLIERVTRIDALSFQPKFNARRGQLEPALVAEKKLIDNLDLVAESFLSRPEEGSQLFLRYQLTPRLQAIGTLDTVTSQTQASVGADLSYTILSKRARLTEFEFSGLNHFRKEKLLEEQRLSQNTQIFRKALPRIERSFKDAYVREGFFHSDIQLACREESNVCRTIDVSIDEGPRSHIQRLEVTHEVLPAHIEASLRKKISRTPYATKEFRENLEREIITYLRSEGYLQAKCETYYETDPELRIDRILHVALTRGEPITIHFQGNSIFSSRELLETINLFKRKQPFGSNTINILARNIETLYREQGYLYATVGVREELEPKDNRKLYTFTIREESPVRVSTVAIRGLTKVTEQELLTELQRQYSKKVKNAVLNPTIAMSEEVREHARLLTQALLLLGFPEAQVSGEIVPEESSATVRIEYTVTENGRLFSNTIRVLDWPKTASMPLMPEAPYSVPKANMYIEQLLTALQESGYLYAALWAEFRDEEFLIHVEEGPREEIRDIRIVGTINIPVNLIKEELPLIPGSHWSQMNIQRARDALLQKGLFSRVRISREPVSEGVSDAVVTVLERPLQSLEVGGGINSVFGLHFFGEAVDRELFLDGRNLSLRFDTFYDDTSGEVSRGLAGLKYSNPHFSRFRLNHTEDIRYEKLDLATQEFDLDRISFSSALATTQEELTLSLSHTIFSEDLSNVTPDAVLDPSLDTGDVLLSFLSFTLGLDHRDNPLVPTSGYNLGTEIRLASSALGSEADYFSVLTRASWLQPIAFNELRFGLASALRIGAAFPFSETDNIPISQRYYLGGRTTIRGFRENSLGPRGANGAVIGGDLLFASNNELRYFPSDAFSLHTFIDAGTVYLQDEPILWEDLRLSTGVGFRYISPIGPIGFDLGFPLDEQRGEPSSRLHFAIGSNF